METGRILSNSSFEREKYSLSNGLFIRLNGTSDSCITPFSNSRMKIHLIGQLLNQSDSTQLDRPDSPLSNTEKIRSLSPSVVELFKKWPSFFFFEKGNRWERELHDFPYRVSHEQKGWILPKFLARVQFASSSKNDIGIDEIEDKLMQERLN